MAWVYLFLAGIFEIVWALSLKNIEGFSKITPIVLTIVGMAISFVFLSFSLKSLPVGTAYAVWTGIGAVGVAVIGMLFYSEPTSLLRIICLILIVTGIIGLKIATPK